jgi:hypothetical protein
MRNVSANVLTLLSRPSVMHFITVAIGPDKSNWYAYHTTNPGGITLSNGEVFMDSASLMHVDAPRLSSNVDREAYKITFADPTFTLRGRIEDGFSNVPVVIRLGFYNTTTGTLGGASPGMPLTNIADTIIAYSGVTDTAAYNVEFDGETMAVLECSSPMGALNMSRSITASKDYLRQINISDTSFDQIYKGSKGLDIVWGKKD